RPSWWRPWLLSRGSCWRGRGLSLHPGVHDPARDLRGPAPPDQPQWYPARQLVDQGQREPLHGEDGDQEPMVKQLVFAAAMAFAVAACVDDRPPVSSVESGPPEDCSVYAKAMFESPNSRGTAGAMLMGCQARNARNGY